MYIGGLKKKKLQYFKQKKLNNLYKVNYLTNINLKSKYYYYLDFIFIRKLDILISRIFGYRIQKVETFFNSNKILVNGTFIYNKHYIVSIGDVIQIAFDTFFSVLCIKYFLRSWCKKYSRSLVINRSTFSFIYCQYHYINSLLRFRL